MLTAFLQAFEESPEDLFLGWNRALCQPRRPDRSARLAERRKRAKFIGDSLVTFPRKLGIH
jgi:hypothetical protein